MDLLKDYQIRSANPSARQFEAFKEQLRTIPPTAARGLLEAQLDYHCLGLLTARDRTSKKEAIFNLALTAMALAGESDQARPMTRRQPVWQDMARAGVSRFVAAYPEADSLLNTVFFSDDPSALRHLDVGVSAAVSPAGEYDDQAFAAGVAIGAIKIS